MTITPLKKLALKRMFEVDPGAAFLNLIEILRQEVTVAIDERIGPALNDAVVKNADILKGDQGDQGDIGDSPEAPTAEAVAKVISGNTEFIKLVKGEKGDGVTLESVVSAIKSDQKFVDSIKGKSGAGPNASAVAMALMANPGFINKVKADDVPLDVVIAGVTNMLSSNRAFVESLKGEPGKSGDSIALNEETAKSVVSLINTLPLQPQFQIDASHVKNLRRMPKGKGTKGKYHPAHGGGDTVVAGSNITITRNSDGTVTITSTSGGGIGSPIAVTPTPDDTTLVYTAASAFTYVVVNGAIYREGHEFSKSSLTITLDSPVGTGGDIYAL